MSERLHIVATGACTPVGGSAESSCAAVRAGISRVTMHPFFRDRRGKPARGARVPTPGPEVMGPSRLAALATWSIAEVLEKARPLMELQPKIFLSLPEQRPGFSDVDAQQVSALVSEKTSLRVELTVPGHAGALQGLEQVNRSPRTTILCGVDSYFTAETLEWLADNEQLKAEGLRTGFIPGEAAGALVVTDETALRRSRLKSLAVLRGVKTSTETRLIRSDEEVLGQGLAAAIEGATRALKRSAEPISQIFCDINGERYRSEEWGMAILRLSHVLTSTDYEAPASCWGDVGAASSILNCVLACQAWARQYARGPRALIWSSSEQGLRGAAILQSGAV